MFESLENAILEIKDDIALNREMFLLLFDNLSKSQVATYLEKDPKTIYNYTENGTFKEGIHFKNKNGKKEYIPSGIIQYKKEEKTRKKEVKKVEKQLNPIANKFLNNRRTVNG